MGIRSDGRPGVGDGGRRLLRWASSLSLIAFFLAIASIFLSWQTTVGGYPGGSFSYHYYVYGTQCAQFGSESTCTTARHLPIALPATEYLIVSVVPLTLTAAVMSRVVSRTPTLSRGIVALSAGFSGAGLAGVLSATVLYAEYSYANGTGLWNSPSTAGPGWNIAVVTAIVLCAAVGLSLRARRNEASPVPRPMGRDGVRDSDRPAGTIGGEVAVVSGR